jgi:hypothetical protein
LANLGDRQTVKNAVLAMQSLNKPFLFGFPRALAN